MKPEAIQPYELFADKKVRVHFRAPTVADYRNFVGMSPHLEEAITTLYLNQMQIPENNKGGQVIDSINWTAEDRRTALYWIFINTRERTVIEQGYQCNHCGNEHGRQIDLVALGEYIIDSNHSMTEKLAVDGVKNGFIQPLRGEAMEYLEYLRNTRDEFEEDSAQWSVAHTDLRIYELAWSLIFKDDDKALTVTEQAEKRFEYLITLNAETHFKQLAAQVRNALSEMRHGLMSEYIDGEMRLVTPPHICPNSEEGDELETILLLPFRYHEFLPSL